MVPESLRPRRFLPAWASRIFAEERRLVLDALILGVVGGLAAQLFVWMQSGVAWLLLEQLAHYRIPDPAHATTSVLPSLPPGAWWRIPLVTTLGGLLSGVLVYGLAPEAEGHGTDAIVRAFHASRGKVRARVAPVKLLSSAITLGSGGSAGREGPTAMFAAGIGSIYAGLLERTDEERRILLLTGAAAGLGAIFRSPIGAALFVIEVLYAEMEFEAAGLVYTTLGAVIGYAVNGLFVGWKPLFQVQPLLATPSVRATLAFIALGLLAGLVGALLPTAFYRMRDLFLALRIPRMLKPALGGLLLGLLALAFPQVLGGGYGWMQAAITGKIAFLTLIALVFAKIVALGLSIGSGGSGGVFAPALFVGAMLGAAVAHVAGLPPASFALVGMAAAFSGAARVPVATLLMVTEMTGGYQLLVPAAATVMLSYLVQTAISPWLRYRTLYEAQVPGRVESGAHASDYLRGVLRLLTERKLSVPQDTAHLDLWTLLEDGLPVDLGEGKQLWAGTVGSGPLARRALEEARPAVGELEVIAVLREEHTLLPHPDLVLRPSDRLIAVGTPEARPWFEEAVRPLRSWSRGGSSPDRR